MEVDETLSVVVVRGSDAHGSLKLRVWSSILRGGAPLPVTEELTFAGVPVNVLVRLCHLEVIFQLPQRRHHQQSEIEDACMWHTHVG